MFDSIKKKIAVFIEKRQRAQKSYISSWILKIEIGNLLIALSTTGLMALGVFPMSITLLVTLAIILGVMGVIGRYIDSVEDDIERLIKYEEHLNQNPSCCLPDSGGNDGV